MAYHETETCTFPLFIQDGVDRLENGLNKLYKVQADVDLLVEAAKVMAVEVEQKVASANVFAEQVCIFCGGGPSSLPSPEC